MFKTKLNNQAVCFAVALSLVTVGVGVAFGQSSQSAGRVMHRAFTSASASSRSSANQVHTVRPFTARLSANRNQVHTLRPFTARLSANPNGVQTLQQSSNRLSANPNRLRTVIPFNPQLRRNPVRTIIPFNPQLNRNPVRTVVPINPQLSQNPVRTIVPINPLPSPNRDWVPRSGELDISLPEDNNNKEDNNDALRLLDP